MGRLATLQGCCEAFAELAGRSAPSAAEWAALDAAVESLEEPTSVMLLADVRVELARRADRDGRPDEALAACDRALAALPENSDALVLRGALRRARGELALAEADWRCALQSARSAVAEYADDAEDEEGEDWQEDPVCRAQVCAGLVAQHELALLLSQLGRHAEADAHLVQLGMARKLSPDLLERPARPAEEFAGAGGPPSLLAGQKRPLATAEICGRPHPDPVLVLDGVLPPRLVSALLAALAPGAPFWTEHGYPTGHFFSYLRALPAGGGAAEPAAGEGGLLGELIGAMRPLVEAHATGLARARRQRGAGNGVGRGGEEEVVRMGWAEWWCHSRGAEGGHQLHFDLDEASLPKPPGGRAQGPKKNKGKGSGARVPAGGGARSPAVSTILYLIPPDETAVAGDGEAEEPRARAAGAAASSECGGPTVIFDQRLGDGKLAERAWLVRAESVEGGRLCLFDGGLLHGVLPGMPAPRRAAPAAAAGGPRGGAAGARRLTLMIGWWPAGQKPPRAARSSGPPFAPCMPEPPPSAPHARWPSMLLGPQRAGAAGGALPMPVPLPLRPISPAWCRVPPLPAPRPRHAPTTSGTGDDKAPNAPCSRSDDEGADGAAEALAGGAALPADALSEVAFFGKWFLPSESAIDDELLGAAR